MSPKRRTDEQDTVIVRTTTIADWLDTMLHASARVDALTSARHRAFMAPRLFGSLAAFAAFPIYLAMRGAPSLIEVIAVAWLIAPIFASYLLSRTGRYELAHALSTLALAGLVMTVAMTSGGIESFVAVWLVVLPLEAALSASRRLVTFAAVLALACTAALFGIGAMGWQAVPIMTSEGHGLFMASGIGAATLYATGIALAAEKLSRTSVTLLSDEEDRYRLLARNMSDVISRHRGNGAVEFISPAIETLLATPAQRLLGHGLFDRVHVADRPAYLTALSDAARGVVGSVEFRLRRDSRGAPDFVWVEMRCRPLDAAPCEASGDAARAECEVVAVLRDVTDRKRQEEALALARAETERADAAKSRFLATMSHELRTPLNAIIGFSEMIVHEQALRIEADKRREYAQLINDSGQHLLSVVNGILDMSKMEAGSFEISAEPFAPRPALVNCCNLLALKARENGIDLVTRAPDDLPVVNGDPRAFKQIVLNLVSNAIKFTERGGTVTVSARAGASHVTLEVADNGVGIGTEDLKRLGEAFFQAGKTYQRRHEGTGLGLSIVKSLVGLHGGEMVVESTLGQGTTIRITLPIAFSPPAKDSNIATLAPAARIPPSQQQVKKSA